MKAGKIFLRISSPTAKKSIKKIEHLVNLSGGKYIESQITSHRTRREAILYERKFLKGQFEEKTLPFLDELLLCKNSLQMVEQQGFEIELVLYPDWHSSRRKIIISEDILQKIAKLEIEFVISLMNGRGDIGDWVKKGMESWSLYYRDFFLNNAKNKVSVCELFYEILENIEYRLIMKYDERKNRIPGFLLFLNQLLIQERYEKLPKNGRIHLICYHRYFDDDFVFSSLTLRKMAYLKAEFFLEWYSCGTVYQDNNFSTEDF